MKLTAQFATQGGLESWAIRYASNGEYSHVDLVLPSGKLLGARSAGGVAVREPGYAPFTKTCRLQVEVKDAVAAYDFAFAQVGKGYNYGAIRDMFLHRDRAFSMNQDKWICDELVYAICMAGGTQLLSTDNPLILTPWEVYLSPLWQH